MSLRGYALVPLTADGTAALPGIEPTRSVAGLVELWQQHPDAPAGVALPASGLLAAAVDADGWEWLKQAAKVEPGDDYRRPAYQDHGGAPLRLVELRPPIGLMRTLTFFGDAGMKANADAFGPGSQVVTRDWLFWEARPRGSWPPAAVPAVSGCSTSPPRTVRSSRRTAAAGPHSGPPAPG